MPSRSRTGTSGDRVQRPCTLACTADVVPTEALALVSTLCIASLRSTLLAHAHAGCEGVRKAELKGQQQQRSLRPGFSRGDGRGRVQLQVSSFPAPHGGDYRTSVTEVSASEYGGWNVHVHPRAYIILVMMTRSHYSGYLLGPTKQDSSSTSMTSQTNTMQSFINIFKMLQVINQSPK